MHVQTTGSVEDDLIDLTSKLGRLSVRDQHGLSSARLTRANMVCPIELLPRWEYMVSLPKEWGRGGSKPDFQGELKQCRRCQQTFRVDYNNMDKMGAKVCHHHWQRPDSSTAAGPRRYGCCGRPVGSSPCTWAHVHVIDYGRSKTQQDCRLLHSLEPFVCSSDQIGTPVCATDPAVHDVLALDVELIYTVKGRHVGSLSVIDKDGVPVLECLIRPDITVVDYNTT